MKNNSIGKRIKHREDMFFRRLFGLLARMAKIDGKVDAWEAHAAEGAFARFLRAMARRKFCVAVFNSAKNGRTPLGRLAAEFELEKGINRAKAYWKRKEQELIDEIKEFTEKLLQEDLCLEQQ